MIDRGKRKIREARNRAAEKADPVRAAKRREWVRDSKRRQMQTPEGRERHRVQVRAAMQRLRMINPDYAAQWERDAKGRWFKAASSADGSVTREFIRELECEVLCPYCLAPLSVVNRVFDHVEPIALGGPHSAENLAAICDNCNGGKGKLRLIQFVLRRHLPRVELDMDHG